MANGLPESSVVGSGAAGNDLGHVDGRVVSDVRVVASARDAEAQSCLALQKISTNSLY